MVKVNFIVNNKVIEKEISTYETIKDIEDLLSEHLNGNKIYHIICKTKYLSMGDKDMIKDVFTLHLDPRRPIRFVCTISSSCKSGDPAF